MGDTIRNKCKTYIPESMPELTLYYVVMPGEVDICDATINDGEISEYLYGLVVDDDRDLWEAEIEAAERKKAEAHAMDQVGEIWESEIIRERLS